MKIPLRESYDTSNVLQMKKLYIAQITLKGSNALLMMVSLAVGL
jgi:hypothetical protein